MRPTKREIELASEVNALKIQVEFIKGQANVMRESYVKIAKEALALAEEYKKESEELKSTIKAMVEEMAKVGEVCDCINSKACPLDECGKFTFHDKIMKLIKEDNEK